MSLRAVRFFLGLTFIVFPLILVGIAVDWRMVVVLVGAASFVVCVTSGIYMILRSFL